MGHALSMARVSHLLLCSALLVPAALATTATTGCASSEQMLSVGDPTPKLSATGHEGTQLDLGALDKPTLVYFYPRDGTPGCTKEACAIRDIWNEYEAAGVLVVGVSTDDKTSHEKFAAEHELPFPLVADTDESWAKAFGVSVRAGYSQRVSFLLDAEGKVAKTYPGVDPGVHAAEVLADAKAL